jgi:DinB superfamily
MNITALQNALNTKYSSFNNLVTGLDEKAFHSKEEGKWDAGEQLLHIYKSIKPLVLAYRLPKFLVGLIFGKSNRSSITYDAVVSNYHAKLAAGGRATKPFQPTILNYQDKETVANKIKIVVDFINKKIASNEEADLDKYLLPHPLLGKITMREMLYFTIYHVEHHENLVRTHLAI